MDEAGGWGSADLVQMLEALSRRAPRRKFQLFTCACLRQLWGHTRELPFRKAVVFAERYAEGLIDHATLRAAFVPAWPWGWERLRSAAVVALAPLDRDLPYWRALEAANEAAALVARRGKYGLWSNPAAQAAAREAQVGLVREIFGPVCREGRFEARWRTEAVVRLAETITDEGAFEELPVLADALEDAGCDDGAALGHLRGGKEHVRGCWAVDLVRGG